MVALEANKTCIQIFSEMKVSIVIPVYGVERYIGHCIDTLMQQTLADVEFIFVNDCTPDRSFDVVEDMIAKYPERRKQITILHHEVNKGLPAARNTGLAVAKGEYIFHCDSDDFLEPTMLEEMYNAAKKQDADYVWCDWYLSYENSERYMTMPACATPDEALKSMLAGGMKYNVWNKLVRRELYSENGIEFPAGHSMGEDMTMIKLAACAKTVAYAPKALYHYVRTNGEAMTQSVSEAKIADMQYNLNSTLEFLSTIKGGTQLEKWFGYFKLQSKFPFLISDQKETLMIWNRLYTEANIYINSKPYESWRSKLLQIFAKYKFYNAIKIYYIVFYKCIYRILYK